MKTVTIKLRIHKLLAEKRLTKYRFIAMTGLGYKNASRILDNETANLKQAKKILLNNPAPNQN